MARSWYDNVVRYFQGDGKESKSDKPKDDGKPKIKTTETSHTPDRPVIKGKSRKEMMDEIIKRDGG